MTCEKCQGSSQVYLCGRCEAELRDMLASLAGDSGWLDVLGESVLGQTRIGEMLRHIRGDETPMRFNPKAADLYDYAHSVLSEWCRDICEQRGVTWLPLNTLETGFIGPLPPDWRRLPTDYRATAHDKAQWLSAHVSAIAGDQGAGVCHREIAELITDIERLVDRPRPRRFVGPCPTQLDNEHNADCDRTHPHPCAVALMAKREATEVVCPACKTTHDIAEVTAQALHDTEDWAFTQRELLDVVLPAFSQPVPSRTFRSWCHGRKLMPVKYLRPDGTHSLTWTGQGDKPMYQLSDVRRLRAERPQKKLTGAAARKAG